MANSFGMDITGGQNSTGADLWFRLYVAKDKAFNVQNATHEEYDQLFRRAVQEYTGLMNAENPDLSEFKKAGGNSSHITACSEHYYRAVSKEMPDVQDFYRYFEAPGLGHCSGGLGGQPLTTFDVAFG
ncbi:hypothetical protein N7471_007112 [Penicillium samsonianum]|uniref:uncharacterized protein n=1 Tax=Penicillium samsonianum TaxID=1882272 RepID=UPI0025494A2A|nr:uncharacterized protein N7471_007112 [Penicillium samsonianum]KAJ6131897.1 hypothetical protein N7471_007112 [Penicillium samsonianum]